MAGASLPEAIGNLTGSSQDERPFEKPPIMTRSCRGAEMQRKRRESQAKRNALGTLHVLCSRWRYPARAQSALLSACRLLTWSGI